ncbi:Tn3 family transposase [Streptomyces sp. 8N706]|uniref:Tn3 family transposase n=1 Tax=Streptomyces sp. 8N706 TaxID=3457416 RepID=UPI003FD45DC6
MFGIFKILGYNFRPRFKNLDDQRFWRASLPGVETGTYGPLEALARNRVNLNKVITHWPDMLREAGSLVTYQVRAYHLLRMFGREGHPTLPGAGVRRVRADRQDRAPAAGGRPGRRHLPAADEPAADRSGVPAQAGPRVWHGKCGTIHQAYEDGMEDQLGALGLVLNAMGLWTTRYIDAAVAQLRAEGHEIPDEDIARLSPLTWGVVRAGDAARTEVGHIIVGALQRQVTRVEGQSVHGLGQARDQLASDRAHPQTAAAAPLSPSSAFDTPQHTARPPRCDRPD